MATAGANLKIVAPNFSGLLFDAVKAGAIGLYHRLPYADTPYYLYGLYALGGLLIFFLLFWYWSNFIR